jgi:uncharacterized protein (TIGR03437 family)
MIVRTTRSQTVAFLVWIMCFCLPLLAQNSGGAQQVRWQAQYTQIYSDDLESIAPTPGPAFSLGPAGSLTSNPAEVIAGNESIKGSYFGSASYTAYLESNPTVLPLTPNHSYTITFQYKILTAPGNGFFAGFYSPTAGAQGNFLPGTLISGSAGSTGTASVTSTLANYSDYIAIWNITSTGAIAIDNIQITDIATGKVIASENAEGTAPTLKSGIQLQGATVTTDPSLVIFGKGSLLLSSRGGFVTNPSVIPMGANTVYTIQFDYRILSPTTTDNVFYAWFQPAGTTDQQSQVTIPAMLKNAAATGTFSTGAQTAGASSYVLTFYAAPGVSLVLDNIIVYRQDEATQNAAPPTWNRVSTAPFPRLSKYVLGSTQGIASSGKAEGQPFTYSVQQIENRLAFSDVIAGLDLWAQTNDPDSIHRIRALNPNAVILPDRVFEGQTTPSPPVLSNTGLNYQLLQNTPNEWKATDTAGNVIFAPGFPGLFFMNMSDHAPPVNGQTWPTALLNFANNQIFPAGLWDGVFFDWLDGQLNGGFPNNNDPALFNYDWNRNGLKDETPASTSEMLRGATTATLQQLNSTVNGTQLIVGNDTPQFAIASLVNGFLFECFNLSWNSGATPASSSPASWRSEFDDYLRMQAVSRSPQINIMEGCGVDASDWNTENNSRPYLAPTTDDLQKHRLSMGTALLGNGFYGYDLRDATSAPYWFDEYSVDSNGNAVEDRTKKGYLGQPISDATELTTPGTLVFQETFDSGSLPSSFNASPTSAVSVASGSLVLSNPDHTKQGAVVVSTNSAAVPLNSGVTYLLTFDWEILETIDYPYGFQVNVASNGPTVDHTFVPGVVAGDSGTMHFPLTVPAAGNWSISFLITNGGGKIAIDNVKIDQGGVGPWRRDFENGFVLVNPFTEPHTFSAADLAGALHRRGIHRIKGTQAPDVNNGQPVTGDLTLGPFDAIILLADPIPLGTPVITAVANAAGGQPGVASASFVSIYGSNFTALPYDDWSKSIANGQLPKQLDGVSVTIGGKPAYIYAITPGQINVQAPDVGNGPVQVVVTTGAGSSAPFATNSQLYSPAFFPWPGNQPVATHLDYSIAAKNGTFSGLATVPAKPGEVITLWGTGFGPTNPAVPAGQEPTVAAPPTQNPVTVTLGGTTVPVLGAVLSSYASVYQIAIQIPASMPDGDYPIVAAINGVQSPPGILFTIQRGQQQ